MFIRIETSSGVPITRQITDQNRAQCVGGGLAPGERLPSVRELARELAVNQNTIVRVYERLTHEGFLESRHGDGTYVAARLPRRAAEGPQRLVVEQIGLAVDAAVDLGMAREQVHDLTDVAFDERERRPGGRRKGVRTWGTPPSRSKE